MRLGKMTTYPGWALGLCLLFLAMGTLSVQTAEGQGSLRIVNVRPNTSTVGRYEKFELTFDVTGTVATNPYFPYDPGPPPGVPAGVGISVDGLFSNDDWATSVVQPGFLYQDYQRDCIGAEEENFCQHWSGQEWRSGREWLYPVGDPVWKIRFAPLETGTWRYRIRATDGSGTIYYPADGDLSFAVVPSNHHGFVRLSPTDSGYFEFSDGTPFIGVGHNSGFESGRYTYSVDERMQRLGENRVSFLRIWMTGSGIYMAPWHAWTSHHLPYEGGYFNAASLTYDEAYDDHLFSLRLWDFPDPGVSDRRNPCMRQGFNNGSPVSLKPNTTYQLRVRLKTAGVTGPRDPGYPYGFTVRKTNYQWLGTACSDPGSTEGQSVRLLEHVSGDTEWHEITGTFTTGPDEYFLGNLYLILENTTAGEAFIDQVSLREMDGGVPAGPEVLRKNRFAYHLYFDQQPSWHWDYVFEKAAQSGVTIRPVVLEKNDWIANHMDESGNLVGDYYELDNSRFYAKPNTAIRRFHEYFWRYLIARWGYSRAVHSWELMNEGDPFNGHHYAQANDFGQYMHAHDPHGHLVTTSNWHSFPIVEFWGNPAYSEVDYADVHAYTCCGTKYDAWSQNIGPPLSLEDGADYVYGGTGHSVRIPGAEQFYHAGATWRSLVIRGEGEWLIRYVMKAESFTGACPYGYPATLAGLRLQWLLDGGPYWGGRSNVVPPAENGKNFVCSAPAGTYDWRAFDSQHTAGGAEAPLSARIVITDDLIHSLSIGFHNSFGSGGEAWIDNVELISPGGERVHLNGQFDMTRIDHDAALLATSYSLRFGGRSLSGPGKPVTRGEVAIGDEEGYQGDHAHDQTNDTQGVWLHNFLWGQVNPGGLYELYWDPYNIRQHDLYYHYKAFRDFMDGIPLTNGCYEDARATTSHPDLRAWGQKDLVHGKAHLWIQNRNHTWQNVIDGITISGLSGQITIPDMSPGPYQIEWWNTCAGAITKTEVVEASSDGLVLDLPAPLSDDVAVKVSQIGPSLGLSSKSVNRPTARPGEVLTYTIAVVNARTMSITATMTDEVPTGTTYIPVSASVTPDIGALDDAAGIQWRGKLGGGESVTITFAVQVGPGEESFAVSNVAVIEAGSERIERRALTIVNARQVHLPLVLKGR